MSDLKVVCVCVCVCFNSSEMFSTSVLGYSISSNPERTELLLRGEGG